MQTLWVFVGIGVVTTVLAAGAVLLQGRPMHQPLALLGLLLGPPAIWLVLGALLSTTSLVVGPQDLCWLLFGVIVLGRYPAASLRRIERGTFSAVRVRTTLGTIHLLGLQVDDRVRLARHLRALNQGLEIAR